MKGDSKVVDQLNAVLKHELTAINQYFLHSRMLRDWGYGKLADRAHEESLDEMKHADRLMQRILLLEGLPNLQDLGKLLVGEGPKEALECDLELERAAHTVLADGVALCETAGDYPSRDLLAGILASEEEHIDWLETQLELIDGVGLENYLQSQMG